MSYGQESDYGDKESSYQEEVSSELKEEHQELYGMLLHANRQIDDAGDFLTIAMLIASVAAGLAVHMEWFDNALGVNLERLRHIVVYIVFGIIDLLAVGYSINFLQRGAYKKLRPQILNQIEIDGISPYKLIARIEGDDALKNVAEQLQADKNFSSYA
jgi:hypothetical protein